MGCQVNVALFVQPPKFAGVVLKGQEPGASPRNPKNRSKPAKRQVPGRVSQPGPPRNQTPKAPSEANA